MPSDCLEIIRNRRSIREYLSDDVSEKSILRVLEAAAWAPSAHDAQPWRFIVIMDYDMKRRLAEAMAREWNEDLLKNGASTKVRKSLAETSINRFVHAPVLVVACVMMGGMDRYVDERRRGLEHLMATQSLAAAIQNMLLEAHSEGLGSCWFCAPLFCQDVVRRVLGIPSDIDPQALVTLGYPSERPATPVRKPLVKIVFKNRWGESF